MQPNPFTNPTPPGAPDPAPRPRDLEGCLVAYACREFTRAGAPGNEKGVGTSDARDRVTVDLLILDIPNTVRGLFQQAPGFVCFGGSPDWDQDPKPHYLYVGAPARFEGAWVSNQNIVKALAPGGQPLRNPDGTPQLLLGRIERSTFGQKPFNIVSVDGTPDMDKAIAVYNALGFGQIAYQQPQAIPGVQAPQRQQATPPAPPMPPPAASAPAFPVPPQAPPAVPQPNGAAPIWPQPGAVDPGPAAVMAAFPGAQAVTPPVPVPPPVAPPPPPGLPPHLLAAGWTPESWASLSAAQQAQVLAATPVQ